MIRNTNAGQVQIPGDPEVQITLGATFSDACKQLPKEMRAKIAKAQSQFFSGPFAAGLHQEKIQGADTDIYSCRLDQDYRIIYKRPEGTNTVLFLYVGKHDDAYAWAETHCCGVNPFTGGIQTSAATTPKVNRITRSPKPLPRLSKLSDEQLKTLEIPEAYWEQLRTRVFLENQLLGYKSLLSEASYVVLESIVCGMPVSDAMDLYAQLNTPINIPVIEARPSAAPLFDAYTNEELASVGIPMEYLDLVRTIRTESELNNLSGKLPEDAMQSLYALRSGETIASIRKLTFSDSKPVGVDDFRAALDNPITKSQFAVMEDEAALKAFMESPMEKWRVFLHPSQRRLVEHNYAGPARILGGAGTGKTVVIVHRAKMLASLCSDDEKVLVTTYSSTLADDIAKRLSSICSTQELSRIEVTTVDAVARKLAQMLRLSIKYNWSRYGSAGEVDKLWATAIGASGKEQKYDIDFFRDEWQDVIQAQQIDTLERYLDARRDGRSKRLDKRNREDVWAVFEQYRALCEKKKCADIDYAENRIAAFFAADPDIKERGLYRSILVDECQDLRPPAFRMLRAVAGQQRENDLYFSGDPRQKIYRGRSSLLQCGIDVRNRSFILKLNYRTTAEIYDAAIRAQQQGYQYDDPDGKALERDKCVCIFHGERPVIRGFTSIDDEMDAVASDIKKRLEAGIPANEICVMTRMNKWCYGCEKGLAQRGIQTLVLKNDQADDPAIGGVRIATMHRVKGMEFTCVYIYGASAGKMPPRELLSKAESEEERLELMQLEANLLSVAMTRAKQVVWVTYEKDPSVLLQSL